MKKILYTPHIIFFFKMSIILFTTISNQSKPILHCSTIQATLYNTTFKKMSKEYHYDEVECTVQWFDGYCDWLSVKNGETEEVFDNRFIPEELLSQIVEFMSDPSNYGFCTEHCHV